MNSKHTQDFGPRVVIKAKSTVRYLQLITFHTIIIQTSKLGYFVSIRRLFPLLNWWQALKQCEYPLINVWEKQQTFIAEVHCINYRFIYQFSFSFSFALIKMKIYFCSVHNVIYIVHAQFNFSNWRAGLCLIKYRQAQIH